MRKLLMGLLVFVFTFGVNAVGSKDKTAVDIATEDITQTATGAWHWLSNIVYDSRLLSTRATPSTVLINHPVHGLVKVTKYNKPKTSVIINHPKHGLFKVTKVDKDAGWVIPGKVRDIHLLKHPKHGWIGVVPKAENCNLLTSPTGCNSVTPNGPKWGPQFLPGQTLSPPSFLPGQTRKMYTLTKSKPVVYLRAPATKPKTRIIVHQQNKLGNFFDTVGNALIVPFNSDFYGYPSSIGGALD